MADPSATHDLSEPDVASLAAAFGFRLAGQDLTEVTHRLNAMRDALTPLAALSLDAADPAPPAPEA